MRIPGSPRSISISLSESPPRLDPSTLAILDSFLASKAEAEKRFHDLAEAAGARVGSLAQDGPDGDQGDPPMMSVDEYRLAFGEDWQLSQFWSAAPVHQRSQPSIEHRCYSPGIPQHSP